MRAGLAPRANMNSSTVRSLKRSDRNERRGFIFICQNLLSATCALICHQLEVVEICAELRIHEESWRALSIPDGIHLVDQPLGGLGVSRPPCFATRPDLSVRGVFDTQLQVVPRVGLPR